ncbi:MAG TPA: lipopolysaccharide biosynthesis protein [Candidatus Thermoplasmatota archaeon]|nr:lipopolysaccharide biosynthesis protein [Candidatus Thermoplasmatota archaeon]
MAAAVEVVEPPVLLKHDRRFLRSLGFMGLAQIAQFALGFAVIALFVRFREPAALGVWTTVLLVATLVSLVAQANLQAAVTRFAGGAKADGAAGRAVRDVFIVGALLALAATVLTAVTILAWGDVLLPPEMALPILVGVPLILFQPIVMLGYSALLVAERNTTAAGLTVVASLADVLVVGAGLWAGASLLAIVAAYVALRAVHAAAGVWLSLAAFPRADRAPLRAWRYLAYAAPALPAVLAAWATTSVERILLVRYAGATELGLYAAVLTVANLLLIIPAPLSGVLFPRVMRLHADNEHQRAGRYLRHAFNYILLLGLPATVGLILVDAHLMAMLVTPSVLVAAHPIVPWAALSAFLWILTAPSIVMMKVLDRTRALGLVWIAATAVVLGVGLLLVPPLGMLGAVLARVLGCATAAGALFWLLRREYAGIMPWSTLARAGAATALMALAVSVVPVSGALALAVSICIGVLVYSGAILSLELLAPPEERVIIALLHPRSWFGVRERPLLDEKGA